MRTTKLVLIVEDEPKLANLLSEYLAQAGFAAHWIANGDAVLEWTSVNTPDLVLLDLTLPGRDGLYLCREIRKHSNLPIIMTTARVDEIDRLLGLEIGADDYICKPYSPREVVARVRALFRRMELAAEPDPTGFGFVVDLERYAVSLNGRTLDLTPVEVRLLSALSTRPGRVLSRDQLLRELHDDDRIVTDRTIDTHVKNLRKKIQRVLPGREVIASVYGVGYKLSSKL